MKGLVFAILVVSMLSAVVGEHVRWSNIIGNQVAEDHPFEEVASVDFLPPNVEIGWTEHARTVRMKNGVAITVVCNNDFGTVIVCNKIRPK